MRENAKEIEALRAKAKAHLMLALIHLEKGKFGSYQDELQIAIELTGKLRVLTGVTSHTPLRKGE